jgi:hypothetical protein
MINYNKLKKIKKIDLSYPFGIETWCFNLLNLIAHND